MNLTQAENINRSWTDVHNIAIEHCLEPMKDAAKGTYNIQIIRRAFSYAHCKLATAVRSNDPATHILRQIVQY